MYKYTLGISAFYHDSAVALLKDDQIVAAVQEERFTRKKNDASFPSSSLRYVLEEASISFSEVQAIVFYDKPYIKFERLLETYYSYAPFGCWSFLKALPIWIKEKLFMETLIWKEFQKSLKIKIPKKQRKNRLFFSEHHLSHAASAFYPSPFSSSAILIIDGVGEWVTTSIMKGKQSQIESLQELHFPHSLGLLYSAFTFYCGFEVNKGEYKLMGLASYASFDHPQVKKYTEWILNFLIRVQDDGSFSLKMDHFDFPTGFVMCRVSKWFKGLGFKPRKPESEISNEYVFLAAAIQRVTEEIILKLAGTAKRITKEKNLVLAGGVALNCVANGRLQEQKIFDNIWIQPSAGDAGGALGAAFSFYYSVYDLNRKPHLLDQMQGSYLGPSFSSKEIRGELNRLKVSFKEIVEDKVLCNSVADLISKGKVIGWFQGRMEWGARALGNRSILADPRNLEMQKRLNLKIKFREGFRPFAPSIKEDKVQKYFENTKSMPYMLMVSNILEKWKLNNLDRQEIGKEKSIFDVLYQSRSSFNAVTHVDYTARVQTVTAKSNPLYYQLLNAFEEKTKLPMLINTSFNRRDEPIVCTPLQAYECFKQTDMDVLVLGSFIIKKDEHA